MDGDGTGGGRRRVRRRWRTRWTAVGLLLALAVLLLGAAALAWPLPDPQLDQVTRLYGNDGQVVAELYRQNRTSVALSDVPPTLRTAVVDTEDVRFYKHGAFDARGIGRAILADVRRGGAAQGGSTITQQLARNLYLSNRRSVWRKASEALLAWKLERRYSKDEILAMYLNSVYFGEGAYGVEAASETYFGKPVGQLSDAQATLLAGLPQAPSAYDPIVHPEAAKARQRLVLARMVAAGDLSRPQADAIARKPLRYAAKRESTGNLASDAFVDEVMRELGRINPDWAEGAYRLGLKVDTTLDPQDQRAAERAAERSLPKAGMVNGVPEPQVALVSVDPRTGAVRAMLGGRDPHQGGFNRALDARRQPGSTFKAFLYAVVLGRRHTFMETQVCEPVTYGSGKDAYTPRDDDPRHPYHYAPLTVRRALAISDNVVAARWTYDVGANAVVDMARAAGITSPLKPTPAVSLGAYGVSPWEMAGAYSVFTNGGFRMTPFAVTRVRDSEGHVLWTRPAPRRKQVLDPGVAYLVTYGLENVLWSGTGSGLGGIVGRPVAGKTGTSDDQKDAWFVGYTPDLVTAVWVGNDQPTPLPGFGADLAGPVWAHYMHDALKGRPTQEWATPDDVVWMTVSAKDGLLPNPTSPTTRVPYLRGTEPTRTSPDWDWQTLWQKLQAASSWQELQAILAPIGTDAWASAPDWLKAWVTQQWLQSQPGGGTGSETPPSEPAPPSEQRPSS